MSRFLPRRSAASLFIGKTVIKLRKDTLEMSHFYPHGLLVGGMLACAYLGSRAQDGDCLIGGDVSERVPLSTLSILVR